MTIDQILKDKGFAIISVKAGETLAAAARTLDGKRIGAVVALDDDGTIIGVLSERDIVRHVARQGAMTDGRLVGVISIGDLVKWKIAETEAEAEAMKSYLSAQY